MVPTARKSGPAESKLPRTCVAAAVISQVSNSSARCGELGTRASGEPVSADMQRRGDLALAEYLDQLAGANCASRLEVGRGNGAAVWVQRRQPIEVHDLVGGLEPGVGEALQLGQPAV